MREIRNCVSKKLYALQNSSQPQVVAATLAQLRHGIGKKPGELPNLWGMIFEDFPEQLFSSSGEPSPGEWAVYTALTLYALHQQGADPKTTPMHCSTQTIGKAMRKLAGKDIDERIEKRFHIAALSTTMEGLSYRLRGLIQMLRQSKIPLDYVQLSEDLYDFQWSDGKNRVRLNWGQDFYRNISDEEENNQEE